MSVATEATGKIITEGAGKSEDSSFPTPVSAVAPKSMDPPTPAHSDDESQRKSPKESQEKGEPMDVLVTESVSESNGHVEVTKDVKTEQDGVVVGESTSTQVISDAPQDVDMTATIAKVEHETNGIPDLENKAENDDGSALKDEQPNAPAETSSESNVQAEDNETSESSTVAENQNDAAKNESSEEISKENDLNADKADDNSSKQDESSEDLLPLFTKEQQRHWSNAIRNLKKNRNSPPFLKPVDPELLGIPDYFKFIKEPMDIGTIEKKLQATSRGLQNTAKSNQLYGAYYPGQTQWAGQEGESSIYRTVFELKADLDKIWSNCFTFNGPPENNVVSSMAHAMQQAAERAWGGTPLAPYVKPVLTEEDVIKIAEEAAAEAEKAAKAAAEAAELARTRPRRASAPPPASLVDPLDGSAAGTGDISMDSSSSNGRAGGIAALAMKDAPGSLSQQRPRREIHAPSRELPYLTHEVKRSRSRGRVSTEQYKFLRDIIREVFKKQYQEFAFAFYEPVDPEKLNVPTYFDVIKKPMDLGTIRTKVEQKDYPDPPYDPFEEDFRLMLNNAYTFNPAGTVVHEYARKLEAVFNRKWAERPTEFSESGSESEDSDVDDPSNDVIARMERQLQELQQNIVAMRTVKNNKKSHKKSKSKSKSTSSSRPQKAASSSLSTSSSSSAVKRSRSNTAPSTDDDFPKVTFDMKSELANKMSDCTPNQLAEAISVIHESHPHLIGNNADGSNTEIELDIDLLDDRTLSRLYQLVCGVKKPKTSSPPAHNQSLDDIEARRIAQLESSLRQFDQSHVNQSRRSALESSDEETDSDSDSD